MDDYEAAPNERSEQYGVEDDTFISEEVIFPRGDGSKNIVKLIGGKMGE